MRPSRPGSISTAPAKRRRGLVGLVTAAGLVLALAAGPAAAAEFSTQSASKVKAAYLLNFTRYVAWPQEAFAGDSSPWVIGILGEDPFGPILARTFEGHLPAQRGFEIVRASRLEDLPRCHIVFVALKDPAERAAALAHFRNTSTLTVGDGADFLEHGGIIGFETSDRVRMSVNLDRARAEALVIQARMLEVAYGVVEHGERRRLR